MIKHILFDAFGTLFAVEKGASANAVLSVLNAHGIQTDGSAFHQEWKSFYRHAALQHPFETERSIFTRRIEHFLHKHSVTADAEALVSDAFHIAGKRLLYPDAVDFFRNLKDLYNISIASNTDNIVLEEVLSKYSLPFSSLFTSENLGCYKPAAAFYQQILGHLKCDPSECLFVGDSYEEDVKGPTEAGMHAILLDRTGAFAFSCPILLSLVDLPAYIETLNR